MDKKSFKNKVEGFSKFSKEEKINWIEKNYFENTPNPILKKYWNNDISLQKIHDEFTENTISNFYLPLGAAPNFLIDKKDYTIPMVIEESSVIAAACKAAKFWRTKGGFKTSIKSFKKTGQVHFIYSGNKTDLMDFFKINKSKFFEDCNSITSNMVKRGGGIIDIELLDKTNDIENYFQLNAIFDTVDSMGANFINSCLEQFASTLKNEAIKSTQLKTETYPIDVIMSILSNYVPECLVRAEVSCNVNSLSIQNGLSGKEYADKFIQAIEIAKTQTTSTTPTQSPKPHFLKPNPTTHSLQPNNPPPIPPLYASIGTSKTCPSLYLRIFTADSSLERSIETASPSVRNSLTMASLTVSSK